jgi:hypothetical protein
MMKDLFNIQLSPVGILVRSKNSMVTCGAIGFRIDKKEYLAYNHFDSYPEGLGQKVFDFLTKYYKQWGILYAELKTLRLIELGKEYPTKWDIKRLSPTTDLGVSDQSTQDWYCLLRKAQGDFEKYLEVGYFPLDGSVDEEYAYIIDLDALFLEIHGCDTLNNGNPIKIVFEDIYPESIAFSNFLREYARNVENEY